ncbi:MAG: lysophospholipid acyltransferase family protein [Phycisphaerales bacterium]
MLERYKQRNPGRSVGAMLFFGFWWTVCWVLLKLLFRLKVRGGENVPTTGPVLYVLNHQSHLDPVMAGMAFTKRHTNFIARSTLFNHKLFGAFLRGLNSVPIVQGAADMVAIRTAIEQMEMGRVLIMFPEGSRTRDGSMHAFKRGAWLVLSRAKPTVLPGAIEGAFDAWPRTQSKPNLWGKRVMLRVGKPIPAETLLAMGPDKGLDYLRQTIEAMRIESADELRRAGQTITTKPMVDTEGD